MQTLKLLSLGLLLAVNPASADEAFRPAEWFAGILEKTAADSVTSLQRVNGNLAGISLSMDKCCFLFFTNHEILEQKMICMINGKETDVLGKEEFFDHEFKRGDSIYSFLLGNVITVPKDVNKIIYVARFSNSSSSATRIECELNAAGEVVHTSIRQVDAKVEFPNSHLPVAE